MIESIDSKIIQRYLMESNLHLLTLENTGWRRFVFGRWAYSSEPFRNDIARRVKGCIFMHEKYMKRLTP